MKRSRKLTMFAAAVIVMVGGVWGFTSLNGATAGVDPSRLATVERGTMVKSVVATGKIEPITKVELKSKANGIIEKLYVDVDQIVVPGQVLAELDKEQLRARVRELEANLLARRAALEAAQAQLTKNTIEAEAPDVEFARRSYERALSLFDQSLLAQSGLDDAKSAMEVAENKQRAAQGQLVVSRARVTEAEAAVAEARAAVERAQEDLANSTIRAPIRATVLTRDVELGSPVSSILNLGANASSS
jgi:HlyD family secretion protein